MGEAKRRKQLDANYGKRPVIEILTPESEHYEAAVDVKKARFGAERENVYLYKCTFPNGLTFVAATYCSIPNYPQNTEIHTTSACFTVPLAKATYEQYKKEIRIMELEIARIFKKESDKAQVIIFDNES
jgi:hypothetical protein